MYPRSCILGNQLKRHSQCHRIRAHQSHPVRESTTRVSTRFSVRPLWTLWYWIRDSMSTRTLWASCQIAHDYMQPIIAHFVTNWLTIGIRQDTAWWNPLPFTCGLPPREQKSPSPGQQDLEIPMQPVKWLHRGGDLSNLIRAVTRLNQYAKLQG